MKAKTQPKHTQGEQFTQSLQAILDYAKEQMNTPDKGGYVIAPDSVLRVHLRNVEVNAQRIVKAVNMHDSLIHFLEQLIDCRNSLSYYSDKSLLDSRIVQAKELLKQSEQK